MSIGSIPWTAIDRFAEREGVADGERFRRLIRSLDDEFLRFAHDGGGDDA